VELAIVLAAGQLIPEMNSPRMFVDPQVDHPCSAVTFAAEEMPMKQAELLTCSLTCQSRRVIP
jgi:hypothetical protein